MKISQNWIPATVVATHDASPTVREFEIAPLEGQALGYAPGAHLQMQVMVQCGRVGSEPRLQTRSYSLVGAPHPDVWRIAVKRLDDGRGGSRAMWRLAVGAR